MRKHQQPPGAEPPAADAGGHRRWQKLRNEYRQSESSLGQGAAASRAASECVRDRQRAYAANTIRPYVAKYTHVA